MPRIVILISGRGSNMQALLEAKLEAEVSAVISNEPAAPGLEIARGHGVRTVVVHHRDFQGRDAFDRALGDAIAAHNPDLVVLAGFMRILTPEFLARFRNRVVNVHPSLLPAFTGTNTHRRALQEGVKIHGCTVHWVTPGLDSGPIIVQAAVPVLPGDDEESLAARVLREEHRVLPQAVRWILDGRTSLHGRQVLIGGNCRYPDPISSPLVA
jgi:phosphoribosylglycinamide formyltransferase 1